MMYTQAQPQVQYTSQFDKAAQLLPISFFWNLRSYQKQFRSMSHVFNSRTQISPMSKGV